MKRNSFVPVSIIFCLALWSTVDAQQRTGAKTPRAKASQAQQQTSRVTQDDKSTYRNETPPQQFKNWKISVVKIERQKEYEVPMFGTVKRPKIEGGEFAVVHAKYVRLPGNEEKELSSTAMELYDLDGKKYDRGFTISLLDSDYHLQMHFFSVPVGTKLKTFTLENLSFDVQKLDSAGAQRPTQPTPAQAEQKMEKTSESATKAGQKLAAQLFKEGVQFCITDAVVEPPNKLNLTVQFNPNIPADKAVKGMLQVKEYPRGSGTFVEVTDHRTTISPSPDPQTIAQEVSGLEADADGAVLIIRLVGLFPDITSADWQRGGIGVSNRVKLERANGKWVVATLNMDSK